MILTISYNICRQKRQLSLRSRNSAYDIRREGSMSSNTGEPKTSYLILKFHGILPLHSPPHLTLQNPEPYNVHKRLGQPAGFLDICRPAALSGGQVKPFRITGAIQHVLGNRKAQWLLWPLLSVPWRAL